MGVLDHLGKKAVKFVYSFEVHALSPWPASRDTGDTGHPLAIHWQSEST